jgi:hypothetical protein
MQVKARATIVSAVVAAMFLVAGAAFAVGGGPESDTTFNYAYDPADQVLLIGLSSWDYSYECTLADPGKLTATYGFGGDGTILVDSLVDPSLESVEFADCNLIGMQLTDASTHGDYLNALHQLLGDMKGWGCVNSVIARSDLGKGSGDGGDDEGTTTTTLEPTTTTTTTLPDIGADGTFEFTTQGVTCTHGKSQDSHGKSGDPHGKSGDPHGNQGNQGNKNDGTDDNS